MQIERKDEKGFHIIKIYGDADAASSISLDKAIQEALQEKKSSILIDCSDLNYIASAGLGVFMSYIQDFQDENIFFALYGLSPKVRNVFEILGLDKLLTIVGSVDEAKLLHNDSLL